MELSYNISLASEASDAARVSLVEVEVQMEAGDCHRNERNMASSDGKISSWQL